METKTLPMIAIIGADGSGKSTIIEKLTEHYTHKYVQDIYVLERSGKKDSEAECETIQNYAKSTRPFLICVIKLMYKALLWHIRYRLEIAPLLRKRTLVISDHFYFLIMALDPVKHRYRGPLRFAWKVFEQVPQPDVYILLDADVSVLYERKQEAPREDVAKLIDRHRDFIENKAQKGFIVDAALPVEQVKNKTSQAISRAIETVA